MLILDKEQMKQFIKDLLSAECGTYIKIENVEIKSCGDLEEIRKEIYNWLSVPERKQSFGG